MFAQQLCPAVVQVPLQQLKLTQSLMAHGAASLVGQLMLAMVALDKGLKDL
jgi:hypothetical protein